MRKWIIIVGVLMAISLSLSQALASENLSTSDLVVGITGQETTVNQTNECVAIQFGQTASGSIDIAGEVDCFTFEGPAGEMVRVRVIETSGGYLASQELQRPDGSPVPASACSSTHPTTLSELTCLLDTAGPHTILIQDPYGIGTGTYELHLQSLNNPLGCLTIDYDQILAGNVIDSAADVDCFTFNGVVDERVRVRVVETSGGLSARQEILRPDGSTVPASNCNPTNPTTEQELTCLLDVTGPHTILIQDHFGLGGTGTYDLYLQRLNNPLGCLTINYDQILAGNTIDSATDVDCFTFNGVVDERVRVRVVETSGGLTARQEILRPDGSTVPASNCNPTNPTTGQELTCLLDVTGPHTILIQDHFGSGGTGTYDLYLQRLNNPVGCLTITYDQLAAGNSIDSAADVDCFTFDGVVDERVRVRVVETSGGLTARQEILRPDGSTVPASNCNPTNPTTEQELTCLLDVTGPHTILIQDHFGSGGTGTYNLYLQRLNNPVGCTILNFDDPPLTNLIDPIADTDCYIFEGDEADQVQVTVVEISGDLTASQELLRPDGTTLPSSACSSTNPTTVQETTCLLDVTGPHTILIRDSSGSGVGEYQIGLACLNAPCGETAVADLSITKTDSPDSVAVGNILTYTLTMTNSGPSAATNVTVVDDLPGTVIYGDATPSQGSCEESNGIVTCNMGDLNPFTSATINISVTPTEAGVITNTADVTADQNDLIPDNSASEDTTVNLAGTTLWIEPPEATFPVSTTFTVDVMITDVTNLFGIDLDLTFDPAIVEVVDDDPGTSGIQIQPGVCPIPDFVVRNEADNAAGTIRYATTALSPSPPCNGGGVVASITFHGLAEGSSPVHFNSWLLSDTDLNPIPVDSTADGTLNVLVAGTLEGTVDVQGRADESGAEVCVWQGGAEFECTTTDAAGYYVLSLPAGIYDVFVEMPRYLDAEKAGVEITAGGTTTLCQVKVLGGDANDDDVINILDLSFIGFRFDRSIGDPGWDPRADINDDGTVNILDIVGAGANFGKTSPVPWPCP